MNWFDKLPGFERSAPGLEWQILRRLPIVTVAATAIPAIAYLYAWLAPAPAVGDSVEKYLTGVAIGAVAWTVTAWTALFTVAIGCVIVVMMKGPAYVADRYPLSDADQPGARHRMPPHD